MNVAESGSTSSSSASSARAGSIVSGPLRAGLVDEIHLYTSPVIVGGGTALWPEDLRLDLELFDERRFGNGVVYTAYRVS